MPTMPRKASPPQPDVANAITEIRQFCDETGTSVLSLSAKVGVAQSALARFLAGERKSITRSARRALEFVRSRHNRHKQHNAILTVIDACDVEGAQMINSAINQLWDGQRQSAGMIAALVLALKPALEIAAGNEFSGHTRK